MMQDDQPVPLRVHNLRKSFGSEPVLRGVNFHVAPGAVHGLVGLNGAGKSTTLAAVLGLLPFNSGEVSLLGVPPQQLYRLGGKVAVVFDEPCLAANLTVQQTLELAAMTTAGALNTSPDELQELLGISRFRHYKLRELSLGNRRRTAIAQALVGEPALIIMDEPFNGLDAGGVDDVLTLIQQLNREKHISFLLASHQLSYLQQVCSHMSFVHQGAIVLSDSMERLLSNSRNRVQLQLDSDQPHAELLAGIAGVELVSAGPEGLVVCDLIDISGAELNRQLVAKGLAVHQLTPHRETLEDKFRELIGAVSARDGMNSAEARHAHG